MIRILLVTTVCALFLSTALHAQVPVTNGLKLWLKADSLSSTHTNGQLVSTWTDSSGNGNNGTVTDDAFSPDISYSTTATSPLDVAGSGVPTRTMRRTTADCS
jgi:hypothetical protein